MEEALAGALGAADDGRGSGSLLAPASSDGIFWINESDRAIDSPSRTLDEEAAHAEDPSSRVSPPPIPPPMLRAFPPLAEPPVATLIEPPVATLIEPPVSTLIEPPIAIDSVATVSESTDADSDDEALPTHQGKREHRAIPALMLLAAALVCGNVLLWNVADAPRGHGFVAVGDGGSAERETASVGDGFEVADETASAGNPVAVADAVSVNDAVAGADATADETASAGDAIAVADAVGVAPETVNVDDVRETAGADVARETARVEDTVATAAAATADDAGVRPVASIADIAKLHEPNDSAAGSAEPKSIARIALPPQDQVCTAGTCTPEGFNPDRTLGTALTWSTSVDKAARDAQDEGKLVYLIHISGNFEDPGFT